MVGRIDLGNIDGRLVNQFIEWVLDNALGSPCLQFGDEMADFVLFDLDPAADAGFPECVQVAHLVRGTLTALGLESYVKTSGSDGVHVLAPIARRHTFADTHLLASTVAGALWIRSHRHSDRTAVW